MEKKKIYNMLKLCTYSWNVSGHQCLLPPSKGVDSWPECLFVDAVFILFLCLCPAQSGARWTVHFHRPRWLGPTVSASLPSLCISKRGGAHFKRYKVLKNVLEKTLKIKKLKKKKRYARKREKATFQDSQSCSTQAKITIACFCNCLDPSSDRPNSRGPPSILY